MSSSEDRNNATELLDFSSDFARTGVSNMEQSCLAKRGGRSHCTVILCFTHEINDKLKKIIINYRRTVNCLSIVIVLYYTVGR